MGQESARLRGKCPEGRKLMPAMNLKAGRVQGKWQVVGRRGKQRVDKVLTTQGPPGRSLGLF